MAPSEAFKDKVVLITGGTGSFGKAFIRELLERHEPRAIRIYSRDELKQSELEQQLAGDSRLRYLLGDVRDVDRLRRAMRDVDVVIHAAALKQVPACEYNPFEAVQTNIIGAENVVSAAIDTGVPKTLALSTDKAVNPANLYGATKLCAEKVVTQGNAYAGKTGDQINCFSSVRYGNVVGSRGSVVPLFKRQADEGVLTITDEAMTRFWITLPQAVEFVIGCTEQMLGGEVFVPRLPSARVTDIAKAVAPDARWEIVGIRPGEKIHEVLLTSEEARHTAAFENHFAIYPAFPFWRPDGFPPGDEVEPGFSYSSGTNVDWLDAEQIRVMIDDVAPQYA
jgi:UDP-N-acetylglucosamine 4,6-dehydratase